MMTAITSIALGDIAAQPSIDDSSRNYGRGSTVESGVLHEGHDAEGGTSGHQLPPIDGGAAAWKALFGAFVFEALLWGMVRSFHQGQNLSAYINLQDSRYPTAFSRTTISNTSHFEAIRISRSWVPLPPV